MGADAGEGTTIGVTKPEHDTAIVVSRDSGTRSDSGIFQVLPDTDMIQDKYVKLPAARTEGVRCEM